MTDHPSLFPNPRDAARWMRKWAATLTYERERLEAAAVELDDALTREAENLDALGEAMSELEDLKVALWKIADGHTDGGLDDDEHPQLVAREALAALRSPQLAKPT